MSHTSCNKDKQGLAVPDTVLLTTQERIEFIASLIVDRIAEDETVDFALLKQIKVTHEPKASIV
jgi:hypothetical protein